MAPIRSDSIALSLEHRSAQYYTGMLLLAAKGTPNGPRARTDLQKPVLLSLIWFGGVQDIWGREFFPKCGAIERRHAERI